MSGFRTLPTLAVLLALAIFYYWHTSTRDDHGSQSAVSPPVELAPPREVPQPEPPAATDATSVAKSVRETVDAPAPIPATGDARLSGWVRNQSGTVLDGIRLELHSQGFGGELPRTRRTDSNARGEFVFDELVAGRSYRLEVRPTRDYAGFSLDPLIAGEGDSFQEIVLEPIRLVDADGMIVDTSLAPIPNFTFRLRSLVVDFPEQVITSDSSGYFRLEGFPEGELRIATSNRDYYRIKGLTLKADEYRTLTLVVDRGNYHLSGFVSDEYGTPQEGARVTIKSAFAEDDYHSFSYRSTLTDRNGAFEFAKLGGNRYTLGVYAQGFESHIRNLEFQSFADTLEVRLERAR